MTELSEAKQNALDRARQYFRYADAHPSILTWRQKAYEDYGFYDGTGQWPQAVLDELRSRGQDAVVVNKIQSLVNQLSGVEIQTRFRVAFRSHSEDIEKDRLAKALTHLVYYSQESQNIPHFASLKFKDSLITGIGWSNVYKEDSQMIYEYVNPYNVIFDPDDLSPEFTNMDYVIRLRWLPLDKCKELWPGKSRYFDSMFSPLSAYTAAGSYSGELMARTNGYMDIYAAGLGNFGSRILIVEVQYRTKKNAYKGFDAQGHYFETFNEAEAEELAQNSQEIEEIEASQIIRTVFTADMLLDHAPLFPNLPNLPDFTYIPSIWSRRFVDGVPDGWVSVMKDLQRESNYRRAKLINNLSSFRVKATADAFPGKTAEEIAELCKHPDAVLLVNNDIKSVEIESNMPLATGQFEMLQLIDQELQQASGMYNDALGKPTNATSGVAIKERQVNSVRNQVFAFDNLKMMKKREGRMFLAYIQGGGDDFIESQILTHEETEAILLNIVRVVNGKKVVFNDVRTLPVDIYVEEVPDFDSSLDEQQVELQSLLANPAAPIIMQSPELMRKLRIRDYEKLAREMQQIAQNQAQMKGVATGPVETGNPTPLPIAGAI